jgi:hypothetical protein
MSTVIKIKKSERENDYIYKKEIQSNGIKELTSTVPRNNKFIQDTLCFFGVVPKGFAF